MDNTSSFFLNPFLILDVGFVVFFEILSLKRLWDKLVQQDMGVWSLKIQQYLRMRTKNKLQKRKIEWLESWEEDRGEKESVSKKGWSVVLNASEGPSKRRSEKESFYIMGNSHCWLWPEHFQWSRYIRSPVGYLEMNWGWESEHIKCKLPFSETGLWSQREREEMMIPNVFVYDEPSHIDL